MSGASCVDYMHKGGVSEASSAVSKGERRRTDVFTPNVVICDAQGAILEIGLRFYLGGFSSSN